MHHRHFAVGLLIGTFSLGCSSETPEVNPAPTLSNDASTTPDAAGGSAGSSQSDAGNDTFPADTTKPQVTWTVDKYTAISGTHTFNATWSDDRAVTKVALIVDDTERGTLDLQAKTIDTTTLDAGLHTIALEASDEAGNTARTSTVEVVLAGAGTFLAFTDGWTAGKIPGWGGFDITVVEEAGSVEDEKAHVEVAAGHRKASVFYHWKGTSSWTLGFDLGTGFCPDDGTRLAKEDTSGAEGMVEVSYQPEAGDLPTGQWFGHVRFPDGPDHPNQSLHGDALFLVLP